MESVQIHNQTVYRDTVKTWRWYDAIGPSVTKWNEDCVVWSEAPYTVTDATNGTAALVEGALGGNLQMDPDATTENHGIQIQLLGEAYYLNGDYPCYFGIRFKFEDADQMDVLAGLAITDTSLLAGVTDAIYFTTVDESDELTFVVENTNSTTTLAAATLTDDTWITAEFYYDGITQVDVYINGVTIGSVALTDANIPDDEYLTPSVAMLTGEGVANALTIDWMRAFQIHV